MRKNFIFCENFPQYIREFPSKNGKSTTFDWGHGSYSIFHAVSGCLHRKIQGFPDFALGFVEMSPKNSIAWRAI